MLTVKEIMSTDVACLPENASLQEAQNLMREKGIRHVPILDEKNHVTGLITQRDILAYTLSDDVDKKHEYTGADLTVSHVMRTQLLTTSENTDLRAAGIKMQQHRVGSLIVLREKELAGIVTDSDYVGLAINLLEQMEYEEPPELDDF